MLGHTGDEGSYSSANDGWSRQLVGVVVYTPAQAFNCADISRSGLLALHLVFKGHSNDSRAQSQLLSRNCLKNTDQKDHASYL
jgi:hypothetical protein